MKTKQEVVIKFRDYGEITVPKGTRLTHGLCTCAQDFTQKHKDLMQSGQLTFEKAQEIANEYYNAANVLLDSNYRNDNYRERVRAAIAKHRANKKKNKPTSGTGESPDQGNRK